MYCPILKTVLTVYPQTMQKGGVKKFSFPFHGMDLLLLPSIRLIMYSTSLMLTICRKIISPSITILCFTDCRSVLLDLISSSSSMIKMRYCMGFSQMELGSEFPSTFFRLKTGPKAAPASTVAERCCPEKDDLLHSSPYFLYPCAATCSCLLAGSLITHSLPCCCCLRCFVQSAGLLQCQFRIPWPN
jgi:hypothetical protein